MTNNRTTLTRWARWAGTFIGFPLAGVTARAVAGDIDSASAAALGGLAGGAVLGAIQAGIGGIEPGQRARWIAATAVGLSVGLTTGAAAVDYDTDAASLVTMGAISGAGVGLAQAAAVAMRTLDRAIWAIATPVLRAGGWWITSQVIVDADRRHAIFGSSGALTVSILAGGLVALRGREVTA
jgi:hypothetical protein